MRGSTVKAAKRGEPVRARKVREMTRNDAAEPDIASGEEAVVRATANPTQAGDWALVLAAAGLRYRLDARRFSVPRCGR